MRVILFLGIALAGMMIATDAAIPVRVDIDKLVKEMTYEEKCGQMTQVTFAVIQKDPYDPDDGDDDQIDENKLIEAIEKYHVGSILNTPLDTAQKKATWQKITTKIQEFSDKYSKSKIPVLYGIDSIHGANYIREAVLFPQPLSMAATWNLDIVKEVSRITALETRSVGIPWNFNPVLDVGRQPLWSRLFETYGEDSYLASKFAEVYVKASQEPSLRNTSTTITCLKHFIGYSYPFNGRDRSVALIPEITLRDHFLPPFEAGVLAGSPTVMINSGEVNGVPGHGNSHYINDILKGELGFEGFTVSDWEDIKRLYTRDKVAASMEEAVRLGVMSGLDMSMVPFDYSFYDHCVSLTKKNDLEFMARVDDANKRILKVKDQAGLFNKFGVPKPEDLDKVGSKESEDINLNAARESIILANNGLNVLPLKRNAKILVTGPTGDLLHVLNGAWSYSWQGQNESFFRKFGNDHNKKLTVFTALKDLSEDGEMNVRFVEGVNFNQVIDIDAVVKAAADVDVIVLCIGEDSYTETLGNIDDLMISDLQLQLADAIIGTGKPYVVVYLGGRPRIFTNIAEKASAVILGFLPGNRGGEAIAEVLFGFYNPNGKLPITYPRAPAGYTTYDYKPLENLNGNRYEFLYPFGHGLSYTTFKYSDLKVNTVEANKKYSVVLKVKNTGTRAGKETVILYLEDEFGSVSRPARQVRGFQKFELQPNEERTVEFELTLKDFMFTNQLNQKVYEAGTFNVYVGDQKGSFSLTESSPTFAPTTIMTSTPSRTTTTPNGSTSNHVTNLLLVAFMPLLSALYSF